LGQNAFWEDGNVNLIIFPFPIGQEASNLVAAEFYTVLVFTILTVQALFQVPRQACAQVAREACQNVPRQQCTSVPRQVLDTFRAKKQFTLLNFAFKMWLGVVIPFLVVKY
jgi:hypothetical protein